MNYECLYMSSLFRNKALTCELLIDSGKLQVGSLAGAAHFLKDNEGVQRLAHQG
jgi:hypothetical protein